MSAHAVTMYYTGNSKSVELIGGGWGVSCEYHLNEHRVWREFRGNTCPGTIEVA